MRPAAIVLALASALILAGCLTEREASPTPSPTHVDRSPTASPAAGAATCTSTKGAGAAVEPIVTLTTSMGTIRLKLFCDKAPVTAQHIAKLVEAGCYDGTKFHRVVRGFMDQGGDPLSKDDARSASWGTGGPNDCGQEPDTITEEFYCKDGTILTTPSGRGVCDKNGGLGLKHDEAGVWSMARTSAPHSSGSQFFLTAAAASFLDGGYTVFGHTADADSTDVVLKINSVTCGGGVCRDPPQGVSRPDTPIVVQSATVAWS